MKKHSRVCAYIDLDAILFNIESMRKKISENTKIMAVVKTDGYGHGAVEIARELENVNSICGYAVATVEEGLILRRNGVKKPILILGCVFPEHYKDVVEADIEPTVFTLEMAKELSVAAEKAGKKCKIHFAIDTGMSRIGYQVTEESADEMAQIKELPHIIIEGIFTHFAKADEYDKKPTYCQIEKFHQMIKMLDDRNVSIPIKHCSNSAGIVEIAEANMDMVRAGITLYGLWPSEEVDKNCIELKPALTLKSHVAYVKKLEAGREISYGGTYVTDKERFIATIPVGYGEGYCRGLSGKGRVLIHGKSAPICGRICMDQFMVDVTDIPNVKIGDEVTLIGTDGAETISMEELGDMSGRFNYEFACNLGKRIPRVFIKNGEVISEKDYFDE